MEKTKLNMEKEDLIIAFHEKINLIEKQFFTDRQEMIEARQGLWERFSIHKFGKIKKEFKNLSGKDDEITFPFIHDFYLKGYKCKN
jgi:hypothetical protein